MFGIQKSRFQNALSIAVADAISRTGSLQDTSRLFPVAEAWHLNETLARTLVRHGDALQTFERNPELDDDNSTRLIMKALYSGYVISSTTSWFNKFCIALLLLHILLALTHTVWVVSSKRQTSNAWDAISEFIALAQRSEPPIEPILANTAAGMRSLRAKKLMAWVEGKHDDSQGGQQHGYDLLQLVLKEGVRSQSSSVKPVKNTLYR